MTISRIARQGAAIVLGLLLGGCQTVYYDAMERVGVHERDILRGRVEDAKKPSRSPTRGCARAVRRAWATPRAATES